MVPSFLTARAERETRKFGPFSGPDERKFIDLSEEIDLVLLYY